MTQEGIKMRPFHWPSQISLKMNPEPTMEQLSLYFCHPLHIAAALNKMSISDLKRIYQKHGIKRWPYNKFKSKSIPMMEGFQEFQLTSDTPTSSQKKFTPKFQTSLVEAPKLLKKTEIPVEQPLIKEVKISKEINFNYEELGSVDFGDEINNILEKISIEDSLLFLP
jgi:hypothetical protein